MDKAGRVLILFNALSRGRKINKADFVNHYAINERTFERDIEAIRNVLAEIHSSAEVCFDKLRNHYYMGDWNTHNGQGLSATEAITVLKILLSSAALRKDEMQGILHSIYGLVIADERKTVINAINKDFERYVSPAHGKAVMKMLEDLTNVIQKSFKIELQYAEDGGILKKYCVLPLTIIFFEYYFYLLAWPNGNEHIRPEVFRIDRIECFKLLEKGRVPYDCEQWDFGKSIPASQFINWGQLINVRLRCHISILENLYNRFPHSKIIQDEGEWVIYNTVALEGSILQWILSQGDNIEILAPEKLRQQLVEQLGKICKLYQKQSIRKAEL